VIFENTPASHVASVMMIVDAGAREDPVGLEGMAHLIEHLSYRASDARQIRNKAILSSIGIEEDGLTDHDKVLFFEIGPADSIGTMFEAEASRLADPLGGLDDATLAVERNVVRNELRQTLETDVSGQSGRWSDELLFPPPHPYGRPVIGSHASLEAISLPDARQWASSHYRPDRTTILVTGRLAGQNAESFVTDRLPAPLCGGIVEARARRRYEPARGPVDEHPEGTPLVRHRADVLTPELWVTWRVPGFLDGKRFIADVWTTLLRDNLKVTSIADGDVNGIDCYSDFRVLGSVIGCRLKLTEASHPQATAKHFMTALAGLNNELPPKLRRAQTRLMNSEAALDETPWMNARERAVAAHFGGTVDTRDKWAAEERLVTLEEVRTFEDRYLGARRAHTMLVERQPANENSSQPVPTDVKKVVPRNEWVVPTKSALNALASVRFLTGMETTTLSNGLLLVMVPRKKAGPVTAILTFRVATEDAAASLAAETAVKSALDSLPSDLRFDMNHWFLRGMAGVSGFGSTAEVEPALQLMAAAVRDYRVEWPSAQFLAESAPRLREAEASPSGKSDRLFQSLLLGEHPFARHVSAADVAAISKPRIVDFLKRTFAPRNGVLVIVGDIEPSRVAAAAERAFSGWRSGTDFEVRPPSAAVPGQSARTPAAWPTTPGIVARAGASQAAIILGCLLPPSNASIDALYDVTASVVASELRTSLREEAGASYEVDVNARSLDGGTAYLRVDVAVGNDELPAALGALRAFWTGVGTGAWHTNSLLFQQVALVRSRLFAFEQSGDLAQRLAGAWQLRRPIATVDDYAAFVRVVRPSDVDAVLRGCADHLVVTITGDEAAIKRASLR